MIIDDNDNGVGWATGTPVCGFVNGSHELPAHSTYLSCITKDTLM
jgi:hypothetical protein